MVILNASQVFSDLNWSNIISGIPGINSLLVLGKAIGIAILIYIIFLIIRGITSILHSRRTKNLLKNVEEINQKMDILIGKANTKIKKK